MTRDAKFTATRTIFLKLIEQNWNCKAGKFLQDVNIAFVHLVLLAVEKMKVELIEHIYGNKRK